MAVPDKSRLGNVSTASLQNLIEMSSPKFRRSTIMYNVHPQVYIVLERGLRGRILRPEFNGHRGPPHIPELRKGGHLRTRNHPGICGIPMFPRRRR